MVLENKHFQLLHLFTKTTVIMPENAGNAPLLHRVLIVGGGLTGLLTGVLLRQKWNARSKVLSPQISSTPSPPPRSLHLTIWERASYNAGRFGAAFEHDGEVIDMGAQVVTVADPSHHNAGHGGHGIPGSCVTAASLEAANLAARGLLIAADPDALAVTEQRIQWPGLMQQYWAPDGMRSLLADFLSRCDAEEMQFNVKVESICKSINDMSTCYAPLQVEATVKVEGTSSKTASKTCLFDTVVVAIPAPDCLEIRGLADLLPAGVAGLLSKIGYDARWSVGVFYESHTVCSALRSWFAGAAELTLDGDWQDGSVGAGAVDAAAAAAAAAKGWHLLARQLEPKRFGNNNNSSAGAGVEAADSRSRCAVVGHTSATFPTPSTTTPPPPNSSFTRDGAVASLHNLVAAGAGLPADEVSAAAVNSKVIDWSVAQMIRPMEAVCEPSPPTACFATRDGLVVTGDFMTQGSFVGCYAAADAASDAILASAIGEALNRD